MRNLSEGWDNWVELNDCDSRLKDLPAYEHFPDDAIPRLEAFQERVRVAKTDSYEAAERLRAATEAVATVIPDETLLKAADRVEEIRRGRNSFDGSVHDLPERQAELRELETNFATKVTDLGRPWDETDLEAFDTSLGVRNRVEAWKERLNQSGEGLRQAELRLEQERRALLDRQLETRETGEQLPADPPALDAAGLTGQQDALRAARGCLAEYDRQRQNHENLRGQLNILTPASPRGGSAAPLPVFALVLVALLGLALAGAGIIQGGQALPVGVAGGLALIVVAIVLWFSRRSDRSPESSPVTSPLGRQTEEAGTAMELSRQTLIDAAAVLELPEQPDGATLDSAEVRLDSIRVQIIAWNAGKNRLEEASRRERSQEQRFADAVQAHEGAAASQQEAQEEWKQWLREHQLDETLTPEGMTSFLANVDTVLGVLGETRRIRTRVIAIEKDIEEFRLKVEPLAAAHTIPLATGNWGQLATGADTLIRLAGTGQGSPVPGERLPLNSRRRNGRSVEDREQRLDGGPAGTGRLHGPWRRPTNRRISDSGPATTIPG